MPQTDRRRNKGINRRIILQDIFINEFLRHLCCGDIRGTAQVTKDYFACQGLTDLEIFWHHVMIPWRSKTTGGKLYHTIEGSGGLYGVMLSLPEKNNASQWGNFVMVDIGCTTPGKTGSERNSFRGKITDGNITVEISEGKACFSPQVYMGTFAGSGRCRKKPYVVVI